MNFFLFLSFSFFFFFFFFLEEGGGARLSDFCLQIIQF